MGALLFCAYETCPAEIKVIHIIRPTLRPLAAFASLTHSLNPPPQAGDFGRLRSEVAELEVCIIFRDAKLALFLGVIYTLY